MLDRCSERSLRMHLYQKTIQRHERCVHWLSDVSENHVCVLELNLLEVNNGWTSGLRPDVWFPHSSSCFSTAAAGDQVPCSGALLKDWCVFYLTAWQSVQVLLPPAGDLWPLNWRQSPEESVFPRVLIRLSEADVLHVFVNGTVLI